MRVIISILVGIILWPANIKAQKVTHPPPPPPPSPKYDYHSSNDNIGLEPGLRIIRYNLIGDFQLGMTKAEYDTLVKTRKILLQTDQQELSIALEPTFINGRLSLLIMKNSSDVFKSNLSDIEKLLSNKFYEAEKTNITDSAGIRQAEKTWTFIYYDVSIHSAVTDQENGTWEGKFIIKFEGNKEYKEMLKSVDKPGD